MNVYKSRKVHRYLAPVLFFPLLLTAMTGVIYRIGNSFFDLPQLYSEMIISFHTGALLGENFRFFYVIFNGMGLLSLLMTGIILKPRHSHR